MNLQQIKDHAASGGKFWNGELSVSIKRIIEKNNYDTFGRELSNECTIYCSRGLEREVYNFKYFIENFSTEEPFFANERKIKFWIENEVQLKTIVKNENVIILANKRTLIGHIDEFPIVAIGVNTGNIYCLDEKLRIKEDKLKKCKSKNMVQFVLGVAILEEE